MAFRFCEFFVSVSFIFVLSSSSAFAGDLRLPVVRSAELIAIVPANSTVVNLALSLDGENLDAYDHLRLAVQSAAVAAGAECSEDQILLPEFDLEFANRTSALARVLLNASEFELTRSNLLALCVLVRNSSADDTHKWLNLGKSVVFRTRPANHASETMSEDAVSLPLAE